jgi:nucleoside-diphosphate-sugar epimerase
MQAGDVPVTFAAVEKAERLLAFRARIPLEQGLAGAVEWYRKSADRRRSTVESRQ